MVVDFRSGERPLPFALKRRERNRISEFFGGYGNVSLSWERAGAVTQRAELCAGMGPVRRLGHAYGIYKKLGLVKWRLCQEWRRGSE
jgi:hypothetical protein